MIKIVKYILVILLLIGAVAGDVILVNSMNNDAQQRFIEILQKNEIPG